MKHHLKIDLHTVWLKSPNTMKPLSEKHRLESWTECDKYVILFIISQLNLLNSELSQYRLKNDTITTFHLLRSLPRNHLSHYTTCFPTAESDQRLHDGKHIKLWNLTWHHSPPSFLFWHFAIFHKKLSLFYCTLSSLLEMGAKSQKHLPFTEQQSMNASPSHYIFP